VPAAPRLLLRLDWYPRLAQALRLGATDFATNFRGNVTSFPCRSQGFAIQNGIGPSCVFTVSFPRFSALPFYL
jgi:hypothetical protein